MKQDDLILVSHELCPYVQRAAIALTEKSVPFTRRNIDLANKPAWFLEVSPLGKTPVLLVGRHAIFESSVILEYLEETQPHPLHPASPLERAEHRAWMEFGSAILNDIAGFYNAPSAETFERKRENLSAKLSRLDDRLSAAPFFTGSTFSLVDAVFGPVFRYFDVFDTVDALELMEAQMQGRSRLQQWREALAARPSVKAAVSRDYNEKLRAFLLRRNEHLARLMLA